MQDDPALRRGSETAFEAAQRIVRWHYQWMVVHDFLRRVVGAEMLAAVLDESGPSPRVDRRFYGWQNEPYMPVEFSVAAYRFGHSMIRGRYKLNTLVGPLPTFTAEPSARRIRWGTSAASASCRGSGPSSGPGSSRSTGPARRPASRAS